MELEREAMTLHELKNWPDCLSLQKMLTGTALECMEHYRFTYTTELLF